MEVKVLFPPSKMVADLMTCICAASMRSTRTEKSAHELLGDFIPSCVSSDLRLHEGCRAKCVQKGIGWSPGWISCRYEATCAERMLIEAKNMKHWGVLEFADFTVSVSGVSRALTHQLVRHRLFSYLQQSQRVVAIGVKEDKLDVEEDWYVTPNTLEEQTKIRDTGFLDRYHGIMREISGFIEELAENNIPEEDVRFILPNATKTHIVIKGNARNWLHFFRMRLDPHAQWEIREMAQKILEEFKKIAPVMFYGAGELDV